jgi:hypothetical protein
MTHKIVIGLFLAFIGWRIYARFRRNIGQQLFRPARLKTYVGIFFVLSVALAFCALGNPPLMLSWLGGLAPGLLLGILALRLTRFETTAEGRFYTPNGHIGIALSLLFVGRMIFRVIAIYSHMSAPGARPPALGESPLTYFTFELLAGYSVAYYTGLLMHYAPRKGQV